MPVIVSHPLVCAVQRFLIVYRLIGSERKMVGVN